MKLDPRHLIQLAEIVDKRSLTVAARQLNTSQPALSRLLTDLENRLGGALFTSRRKALVPTELCLSLAEQGRNIRSAAEQASAIANRSSTGQQGEVRIGAPPFFAERVIGEFIGRRLNTAPGVHIVLQVNYAHGLREMLVDDQLDVVVGPVEILESSELNIEAQFFDRNVIACRPGHPYLAAPHISVEMLAQASWISHSRNSNLYQDMRASLLASGVSHLKRMALESSSAGAVRMSLLSTDALTVLPNLVVAGLVAAGEVSLLPFRLPGPHRQFGIMSHGRRRTPAISEFVGELKVELAAKTKKTEQLWQDTLGKHEAKQGEIAVS